MSLNPFRTALTIIPYNVAMVLTLVAALRFLVLGNRIAPKYIVCSGIILLTIGLIVLYTSLHIQVTSLQLMPGLILMGMGSGLFSAYISPLAFSAATARDQTQCPGIFNPVQNLGSSLGRGILGTSLVR
jgi:dipeptide/tripeptide permease